MYVTLYTDVILTHTFSLQGELHTRPIEAGGVCYVVYRCYTHTHFLSTGGTTYTSDRGWGCMLRCIQMLYSHTLSLYRGNYIHVR